MKILAVEDDPTTRYLLARLLQNSGHEPVFCSSAEEAQEVYGSGSFPVILLDLYLPKMSGFDLCRWVRSQPGGERPYILVITASKESEDLRRILEAGADDYVSKPLQQIGMDVRLTVAEQHLKIQAARRELEDALRQERERLAFLAAHDPLTTLCNRAQFSARLATAVEEAGQGSEGAVLYVDLDNFKIVNDTLGHAAGDRLLVQVAYLLRNALRRDDLAARFGGDEFVALLQNISLPEARLIADRICTRLHDLIFSDSGRTFHIGASVGVAAFDGSVWPENVLAHADAACYAAKARGRNRVVVYQPDNQELEQLRRDSDWSRQVREAIRANRLELWFQPVIEVSSHQVSSYETLLRLRTADGELVEPDTFLPSVERFRLAPDIDRWTVQAAARALHQFPGVRLNVNLSGQSVGHQGVLDAIERHLLGGGIVPHRVTFEITESAVVASLATAQATVERLRRDGFHVALDDFGAGASSFRYLRHLPVDFLKIDGSFTRELLVDPVNLVFVRAIHEIARSLKIRTVAEYVESADVLEAVRGVGIQYAQGFFFGKPAPQLPPLPAGDLACA